MYRLLSHALGSGAPERGTTSTDVLRHEGVGADQSGSGAAARGIRIVWMKNFPHVQFRFNVSNRVAQSGRKQSVPLVTWELGALQVLTTSAPALLVPSIRPRT